jgi:predicted nucleic acid-binding protein
MKGKVFVDTNLWVYLYSDKPKADRVRSLLDKHFAELIISTQVLGELFNVLVKKGFKSKEKAQEIISDLVENFRVIEIDKSFVLKGIEISIEYGYSYWDSLIIASALENDCSTLFTEDMHHGQLIERKLKISDPFKDIAP